MICHVCTIQIGPGFSEPSPFMAGPYPLCSRCHQWLSEEGSLELPDNSSLSRENNRRTPKVHYYLTVNGKIRKGAS